jgi:hypothetical protein
MEIKYDGKECDPRITRYSIKGLEGYSGHVLKHNGQFTDLDLVLNIEGVPHWTVYYGKIHASNNKKELEKEVEKAIQEFKKELKTLILFLQMRGGLE